MRSNFEQQIHVLQERLSAQAKEAAALKEKERELTDQLEQLKETQKQLVAASVREGQMVAPKLKKRGPKPKAHQRRRGTSAAKSNRLVPHARLRSEGITAKRAVAMAAAIKAAVAKKSEDGTLAAI